MTFKELATQEKAAVGFTHQLVMTANDLTMVTVNTAQSFNIAALPVGSIIDRALTRLVTPFKDVSDAAFNLTPISVGDTGSATRFCNAQELNENGTEITAPISTLIATPAPYAAGQFLTASFGSMAAKALKDIDVGEVHVFINLIDAKKLSDLQMATPLTK
jgi:hypothetical protein